MDPHPPPAQAYLELPAVQSPLRALQKVPESHENLYRMLMSAILQYTFPVSEGYNVVQELKDEDSHPDFTALRVLCSPGGSVYSYELLMVESKKKGEPWGATEDQLYNHLEGCTNEAKNVYGMVHIGLEVKFFKYEEPNFTVLSGKLRLVQDVHEVSSWFNYAKTNALHLG